MRLAVPTAACPYSRTFRYGARRGARDIKCMKAKDWVTVALFCNATGTEKLAAALIGSSKVQICFKGPSFPSFPTWTNRARGWTAHASRNGFMRRLYPGS